MNYKRDITEEKQGARHYRKMARKKPSQKIALESMADDELKHGKMLRKMSSLGRAINRAKK